MSEWWHVYPPLSGIKLTLGITSALYLICYAML